MESLDQDHVLVAVGSAQGPGRSRSRWLTSAEGRPAGRSLLDAARPRGPRRVEEDGTFKSADELRELCTQGKGVIEDGKPIIAYCRIGERSAHTWFVLHELLARRT